MELGSGGDVTGEQTALEVKGQSKHTALAERADAGPRVLSGPALPQSPFGSHRQLSAKCLFPNGLFCQNKNSGGF